MSAAYLWVKAFHIVFVASWFAGLFYLPRLFVNLAQVGPESHAERERLVLMARKLYRFTSGLMVPAVALGLWLWLGFGVSGGWLHAKLALVLLALGYHHACRSLLKRFETSRNRRSERWFRVFNESAVLLFAAIVVLVVVKPFLMAAHQRSSAAPLAAAFALLVVYASLYPFTGWRPLPGRSLLDLLALPWPPWRNRFDEAANLFGYMPLGALLYGAVVRGGGPARAAAAVGVLVPAGLSYALELAQNYLPYRVPSLKDWVCNGLGALLGVAAAAALHRLGVADRWQATRERWFVRQSSGALALLLLWPVGLLFPAPLPLGLGQIGGELRGWAEAALADTPWAERAAPLLEAGPPAFDTLSPAHEGAAIALGLLAPCLVAFSVTRRGRRRLALVAGALGLAVIASTLSTALNFGPDHALAWLSPLTGWSLAAGAALAALGSPLGARLAAGLGLVALTALVALVAQAPSDPYYAASLQAWEQGRFIRFHGLARWVGWLWPYLAIAWLLARLGTRDDPPAHAHHSR